MESIAQDTLRDILLKLPTRDIARCRCVCKRWCLLLTSPSFLTLHVHAAHVVSGAGEDGLLISKSKYSPDRIPEFVLFDLSSPMPLCRCSDLDMPEYGPANACNGFLCLVSDRQGSPFVVCNPISGEKLRIPGPPKVESISSYVDLIFAMGFSPSTCQYKLFRLSFPSTIYEKAYMDVCTLGDNALWRRRQLHLRSSCHKMRSWPVLINGKLYVVTTTSELRSTLDVVLVIDVTSEAVHTHSRPKLRMSWENMTVDTLELHGQLCVAIHDLKMPSPRLTFWVLRTMEKQNIKDDNDMWELVYSLDMEEPVCPHYHCYYRCECHPRGTWLNESDGVLCYLTGGHLHKYETTVKRRSQYPLLPASNKEWDHRLRLQPSDQYCWNVYGGYRPSLLSPHHFATSVSSLQRDELPLEHPLLQNMQCHTPSKKRRRSPCSSVDNGTNNQRYF